MKSNRPCWGLLRRRECLVPTGKGWTGLAVLFLALLLAAIRGVHPFLAVNEPLENGMLVVEGWLPDAGMRMAVAEFGRNHYKNVFVTGGPITTGGFLSEYQTAAQLGAATLRRLGLSNEVVQAVPTPAVLQDRTYASALALRKWLEQHGLHPAGLNVISYGPHGRRTRLLFEKAMGSRVKIGIIAVQVEDYDPQHWWASSQGFRTVTGETIAYLYARCVFWNPRAPSP